LSKRQADRAAVDPPDATTTDVVTPTTPDPSTSVLRYSSFAFFWFSRILSTMAFQAQTVGVGWQMYALTGDPLDLGLVGLVQFVPILALTLVVGHVADRYDRRLILCICQAIEALTAAVLVAGSIGGWLTRESLLAIVAILGAARAFEEPTRAAMLPGLVPRSLLSRATALYASASQFARIIGPALGGFLYVLGPTAAYSAATVAYAVAAVLPAFIAITRTVRTREPVSVASVLSGLVFIWSKPIILGALSLDLFVVLLGGATALLPIYARDILETGPWGLGLLRAAPGVGAIFVAIVLARQSLRRGVGPILFASVTVFGLATLAFGVSSSMSVSLVALAILGAANVVSVVIRWSLIQLHTPDEMRGRVTAVNSLFTGTSNQLGDFESGLTASWFGAVPAVLIGGIGTVGVALLWMRLFPALRQARSLDE
jgi:MFS family permease